jgi:hypothetical protein
MSKRTITLTDRCPVTIDEDAWPVIAAADWFEGQYEGQANRKAHIRVRAHADGRHLVYGVFTSRHQGESDHRAGYLIPASDQVPGTMPNCPVVAAIHAVSKKVWRDLADEVIADLPPVELDAPTEPRLDEVAP